VAGAAVALAVAEVVAVVTGPVSAPLVSVGAVVIDHTPLWLREFATSTFGTGDKAALLIGTSVLLAVFGAVIGVLAMRRPWVGYLGVSVFGAIGVAAAYTRELGGPIATLPSLIGAGFGGYALDRLLRVNGEPRVDDAAGRRRFLFTSGGVLAGAAVVGAGAQNLVGRKDVTAARAKVRLPTPVSAASAPPQADQGVPDQTPFVTGNSDFYRIDTALTVPQVNPDTWKLRIHGRVDHPYEITYAELLAMPMVERYVTLACVSNVVGGDLIGNAKWLGVPLKGLLERAAPQVGADQVVGRAVDGFTVGTPTEVLLDGRDALLVVGMNGEPLPIEHGFPARVVVPGLYGYVSATKWISELELSSFNDFDAYWVRQGWAQQAPIKTESRIDTPRAGSHPHPGTVTVAGVAWAQHRGISKVEVRVDGGDWNTATLAAVPSVDTWRQWSWSWPATPGTHELAVRATDNAGETQPEERSSAAPDGATGYHTIKVDVQ
jgi:DMSO/TMAO reductase YedYZ molybdopterin-dependent catalytic subunit